MSEVHFEIFRQQRGDGSWSLVEVLENRDEALARARRMLQEGRAPAVRVVKETFNPATGGYVGLTLFEDGRVNRKKKNTKIDEIEDLPQCMTADDLYTYNVRALIARTLGEWLARNRLTVTELLHSSPALQKLDSQGTILQHALQKIAVSRAFGSDVPVTKIIRELNELCMAGIRRVYRDDKAALFDGGGVGRFGALAEKLSGASDADYRLNGALAKHLAAATTWDAKLALLLSVAAEAPQTEEPRLHLLTATDALVAEILGTPAALVDLLGATPDLGHALLNLIALFLGGNAEGRSPAAKALALVFARDALPEARSAVATRILSELRSMKRLCPASWDAELSMLRLLSNALIRARGKYLAHEDLIDSFAERSKRFVTHEPLYQYLQDARTPDQKVDRLLTAEESIIGAENKRELATFILPLIGSHSFEEQMPQGVLTRLKRLADLQHRVEHSGFQEVQLNQLAAALDAVAKVVEERAKLLSSLETRVPNPVERVQALIKLAGAGAFTHGELQKKARRFMLASLATPGFISSYLARQEKDTGAPVDRDMALRELTRELSLLGITLDEASRALGVEDIYAA